MSSRRMMQRREFIRLGLAGGMMAFGATHLGTRASASDNVRVPPKSAPILTPEMFGAYGDWNGASGTDDTFAIQKFFDALQSRESRGVFSNRYRITRTVFYGSNTHVSGDGEIYFDSPSDVPKGGGVALMPETYHFADNIHWVENCSFSNFRINAQSARKNQANGISASKARNLLFDSLRGTSVYWHFLDLNGCENVVAKGCVFSGAGNAAIQVDCLSAAGGSQALLSNNTLRGAAWSAIDEGWNCTKNIRVFDNKIFNCFGGVHLHRKFAENINIEFNYIIDCKKAIFDDGVSGWKNVIIGGNFIYYKNMPEDGGVILNNKYESSNIAQK